MVAGSVFNFIGFHAYQIIFMHPEHSSVKLQLHIVVSGQGGKGGTPLVLQTNFFLIIID